MAGAERDSDASSDAIMADLWAVPDGNQSDLLDGLSKLFEELRESPGFIEGQILRSTDPTKFLAYARFESTEAQQRVRDSPATAAAVRTLRAIAHQDLGRYTLAESFLPPD